MALTVWGAVAFRWLGAFTGLGIGLGEFEGVLRPQNLNPKPGAGDCRFGWGSTVRGFWAEGWTFRVYLLVSPFGGPQWANVGPRF